MMIDPKIIKKSELNLPISKWQEHSKSLIQDFQTLKFWKHQIVMKNWFYVLFLIFILSALATAIILLPVWWNRIIFGTVMIIPLTSFYFCVKSILYVSQYDWKVIENKLKMINLINLGWHFYDFHFNMLDVNSKDLIVKYLKEIKNNFTKELTFVQIKLALIYDTYLIKWKWLKIASIIGILTLIVDLIWPIPLLKK